jgi:tRNA nucleotidyltransferase/poly(A) polymerase
MPSIDPQRARDFAVDVVKRLRDAGYNALWAGGCVRDQLLKLPPKDYDVATDAIPDQIRSVFGYRRTLAIGQAFGVITVLGPKRSGQVEVATFRRDATYSDGRHPDEVTFCDAREDALRRDFTINGMFYDPLEGRVIDYVGGQEDLRRRLVRAIGDPAARLAEDKLRMMRAVRIAAHFAFDLDPETLAAIRAQAVEISVVSAERITGELRRMLTGDHRARAVDLLRQAGLLGVVLPELSGMVADGESDRGQAAWGTALGVLQRVPQPPFSVALAALIRPAAGASPSGCEALRQLSDRLKLTGSERKEAEFLLAHEAEVRSARSLPWPRLQRVLIQPGASRLVEFCRALAETTGEDLADVDYCQQKLSLPADILNPPPLVSGDDLRAMGLRPGPAYGRVLHAVRDAQLQGQISTKQDALEMARRLFQESG